MGQLSISCLKVFNQIVRFVLKISDIILFFALNIKSVSIDAFFNIIDIFESI